METLSKTFNAWINSDQPLLVDFYAEWCGPCKMMPPILKEVKDALGDTIRIIKVDIDKHPDLAAQLQVQSVPTLMIFRNGALKWRQSGVLPARQLQHLLEQQL